MARISKAEHARILRLVDVDGRKVAEVAAEYGCTPANIYALLSKLRRTGVEAGKTDASAPSHENQAGIAVRSDVRAAKATRTTTPLPVIDLLSAVAVERSVATEAAAEPTNGQRAPEVGQVQSPDVHTQAIAGRSSAAFASHPEAIPAPAVLPAPAASKRAPAPVPELPRKGTVKGGVGGALAKPGFGLMMRTEDGDEHLTPFRSLDDLLSAVKPILRTAARSTEPVWFSIRPVDLATLDSDAG